MSRVIQVFQIVNIHQTGPIVWYQQFEYAVGHWLQKAAEHKLGSVLCCPGCFSLFRGSALMDDNVMRRYADKSTEAAHYVQYDQGLILYIHNLEFCFFSNSKMIRFSRRRPLVNNITAPARLSC